LKGILKKNDCLARLGRLFANVLFKVSSMLWEFIHAVGLLANAKEKLR
jgi:hypothetical protein